MEATKIAISRYCEECLAFRQKRCEGKSQSQKTVLYFGSRQGVRRLVTGLHFCKQYEFDERLYKFTDGSGKVETFKVVRKRQAKRDEEISVQENIDIVDIGENLKSSDFADLLI